MDILFEQKSFSYTYRHNIEYYFPIEENFLNQIKTIWTNFQGIP